MCLLDGGGLVECSRGAVGHRGGVVVGGAVVVGGGGRGAPSADLLESLCVVVVSQVDKLVEGASVNHGCGGDEPTQCPTMRNVFGASLIIG